LEKSPVWLYEYDAHYDFERSLKALSNNELTCVLQKPASEADWDWDVINVQRITRDDRITMLSGQQIHQLVVFPATHEATKSFVVERVFAIILNQDRYEHMTQHDHFLVSAAWQRAHRGRQYEAVKLGAYTVYQMTAITTDASTSSDTAELDTTLRDYEIGRVSTDPWELRLLAKMLDTERRGP
jgi:hypothetical protein